MNTFISKNSERGKKNIVKTGTQIVCIILLSKAIQKKQNTYTDKMGLNVLNTILALINNLAKNDRLKYSKITHRRCLKYTGWNRAGRL